MSNKHKSKIGDYSDKNVEGKRRERQHESKRHRKRRHEPNESERTAEISMIEVKNCDTGNSEALSSFINKHSTDCPINKVTEQSTYDVKRDSAAKLSADKVLTRSSESTVRNREQYVDEKIGKAGFIHGNLTNDSRETPLNDSLRTQSQFCKSVEKINVKHSHGEISEVNCTDEHGNDADYSNINWEEHRRMLDSIFFCDDDLIKKGSAEYDDFWVFVRKFLAFQRKQSATKKTVAKLNTDATNGTNGSQSTFELPSEYDKRYRLNISLLTKDMESRMMTAQRRCRDTDKAFLNRNAVMAFRSIILHYIDFLQKQKFSRLMKVKRDQRNLPIFEHRNEIVEAIAMNQVIVVAGDTGCGKSTQVPQYLLAAGYTRIACTQPRRIACISLSRRVAFETLNEYGSEVAYQVRFERSRTQSTRILFLTEGLLLRQIESDPMLTQYSVLVVDEVHERHIHTDFLLGVIKCILVQRPDLKLVLMSATINIDLFSNYFDNAPVCRVPGRLYPIEVHYQPMDTRDMSATGAKADRFDPSPYIRVLQKIDHKYPLKERGDVLIFLSGLSDIMAVVEAARAYAQKANSWIVLPLHSALSIAEQDKVFDFPPEGVRKCIVSTNIAETSVTIDGVRFVVDSGRVKEMSFDATYKMQRLQEFWISRASAEQRKGRAGRTGPGVCFRLYAESDYDALQEYSTPEIRRVPLDSLVLQMISMGLPDARRFPFIEPPPMSTIESSIAYLKDQGALSEDEKLTTIGGMLAQLPVDVVIGKMLIMASVFDMIDIVLTIAAALCVQSVFTARAQRDYDASVLRRSMESDHGDPMTLLNAYDEWVAKKAEGADSRKWCRHRGLEEQRFYEITKLKQQFHGLLAEHGLLRRQADIDEDEAMADSALTPAERREKHANRRRLAQLRHEQKRNTKKRKILKMDDRDWNIASDDDDSKLDDPSTDIDSNIRDLEFRLTNEVGQLEQQANESRRMSIKDATLLKVILCSGLYPQVAIADEHNSFKRDSDQAFHTRSKGFVLLHPTSIFSTNPEPLQLKECQVKESGSMRRGPSNRGQLSYAHQLVAFVSLVETTKPYIVGALRVPAMQTLLLFAQSVDTNVDCSRVVCDGWLEIAFENAEEGEASLSAAVKLRAAWQQLLKQKLESSGRRRGVTEGDRDRRRRSEHVQKALRTKLAEFLHTDVYYYVRRIHTAEQSHLYRGNIEEETAGSSGVISSSSSLAGFLSGASVPHPTKGGTIVGGPGGFLVYNSLQDDDTSSVWGEYTTCMQRHWTCPHCDRSLIVTIGERLEHEELCERQRLEAAAEAYVRDAEEKVEQTRVDALRQKFRCQTCEKMFSFTTAEAIKHQKTCTASGVQVQ